MKKIYCDECGKEIQKDKFIELFFKSEGKDFLYFELCSACTMKLLDWLKGKCACQKQDKPVCKIDNWQSIKALSARYKTTPRKMNTIMAQMHVERRMKKDGVNWWYEYHITAEISQKLTKKLNGGKK